MKANCLIIFIALFFIVSIPSCIHSNVFEKNVAMPSNKWKETFQPVYTFDITDTTKTYNLFLTMRHTDAYPFSNIWLNVKMLKPGEKEYTNVKIEIPLAQPDGKWLGRGMNEIWEQLMPLTRDGEPLHFSKQGEYKIQLEQIMRTNPLPEVMSVGIRLEKNQ